jgi:hypothetical protein
MGVVLPKAGQAWIEANGQDSGPFPSVGCISLRQKEVVKGVQVVEVIKDSNDVSSITSTP